MRNGKLAAAMALLVAGSAFAWGNDNPWQDLNRAQQRYQQDNQKANHEYQQDVGSAQQNYQRELQRAQEEYRRDIQRAYRGGYPNYGDMHEAQREYSQDAGRSQQRYGQRVAKARYEYQRAVERAQRRYQSALNEYYEDVYDWQHRGRGNQGGIWDRIVGRNRHYDDWNSRSRWDSPTYGRDWSTYYWDQNYSNGWRPYNQADRHVSTQDPRRTTYWQTSDGGWGYYRPHEDDRLGASNWNLTVGVGSRFPGHVNYDPYTYARNPRYSYDYYRDYRWADHRLNYRNQPSFQLAGSMNYYGDGYMYGNLYFPIR